MSTGPDDRLQLPRPAFETPQSAPGGGRPELPDLEDEEGGGLDFRRIVSAITRYRWLILGLGVLGLGAGYGVGRIQRPVFTAQATIGVEVTAPGGAAGPVGGQQLLQAQGWLDLLRSFEVLDEVVRRRKLYLEVFSEADAPSFKDFGIGSTFTPGVYSVAVDSLAGTVRLLSEAGAVLEEGAVGDSIGRSVGFLWEPKSLRPGSTIGFRVRMPRDAAVRLNEGLRATLPPMNGYFLRIELSGIDAEFTAATVNEIANRFIEVATELKKEKLTLRTQILQRQLATAGEEKRNAERALQTFRVRTITLPNDRGGTPINAGLVQTRDPVFAAYFQLRTERDGLANERTALQRALNTPLDSTSQLIEALSAIESVAQSTELTAALTELGTKRAEAARLRLGFSATHPPLMRLEADIRQLERAQVRDRARVLLAALDNRLADFDTRITSASRELQQIPPRALEEARLESELDVANDVFGTLRNAFEQAKLAELSALPDVRIMDSATVPTTPTVDKLSVILAGGLVGGLALGFALALLLDRIDSRLRYPDQVTKELGLSILGALPSLRARRSGLPDAQEAAHLLEALRTIRMNLTFAHGAAGPFITTITSPGVGDGKSFLSANLARAFASSGRRTLLIDADTRRGLLHRSMGVDRKPGLLDYLSGDEPRERVVRTIPEWGIDFMPCGTRKSGGPELLASAAMAQLIGGLRSEYQAIIIDSPPLGAGVDPLVLGSLTSSLVLVLRNGRTDRELAGAKLGDLQRLPIRILGAVVNEVKSEGVYRYYSYLPGYRAEDEVETPDRPGPTLLGSR